MLSKRAKKYLKEVFGYNKVKDIDDLTIECIKENIALEDYKNQYPIDREILKEYQKIYLFKKNK